MVYMNAFSSDETARLAALRDVEILDTAPEQPYDDLVALAAVICDMPIAAINFIDSDRQWSKAVVGLKSSDVARDTSLCASTICQPDGMLVIADTRADPAWADNPQVAGAPGLRSYAGAAIVSDEGYPLGSVCVADTRGPCQLSGTQLEALRMLARQAAAHLSLRRTTAELARVTTQPGEQAIRDALTGLPNRAFFQEALRLSLGQRGTGRPGVLFCDVNGLGQINDRLGDPAGDELLQLTARRITRVARVGDLVARFAGGGFAVLCPGIEREGDLDAIAERLVEAVTEPTTIAATELLPGLAVSAAVARDGEDVAALMHRAAVAVHPATPGQAAASPPTLAA